MEFFSERTNYKMHQKQQLSIALNARSELRLKFGFLWNEKTRKFD